MTRRDYVLLHAVFKAELSVAPLLREAPRTEVIYGVARTIAYCIKADNPSFDVPRFLADCGVPYAAAPAAILDPQ